MQFLIIVFKECINILGQCIYGGGWEGCGGGVGVGVGWVLAKTKTKK